MDMLRIGLTGGVGSGKSAVAAVWAAEGVPILESDAIGRALMQPGEAVYTRIVETFGPEVVLTGGELDRAALAREAFSGGRLAELNQIVHPAVLAAQEQALETLASAGQHTLAVVESALIFEASEDWRNRFDRLVLVAAPEALRVERYVARAGGPGISQAQKAKLREDAQRRSAAQLPEETKRPFCDYVIDNSRTLVLLRREALRVLAGLRRDAETYPAATARL